MFLSTLFLIVLIATYGVFANIVALIKAEDDGESYAQDKLSTIKNIRRIVFGVEIAIIAVLAVATSLFFTTDREIGFVETFGSVQTIDGSGPHFKWPFVSKAYVFDATVQSGTIGYDEVTEESEYKDSLMITADFNLVNADFNYQFQISDPIAYQYGSNNPRGILRNALISAIRGNIGLNTIDDVMTTGKAAIEADIYDDVVNMLEEHQTGLSLVQVSFQDSEPPTQDVKKAFDDVEAARQQAEIKRNEAEAYAKSKIPEANGNATKVISEASAFRTARINQAAEEVARFNSLYAQYQRNPQVVKQLLYYQMVQDVLPNMQVVIGEDSKVVLFNGTNTLAPAISTTVGD